MKTTTRFIADDGKEFEEENECKKHEHKLKNNNFNTTVLLFDKCGRRLPLTKANVAACVFIVCKTNEAARYLFEEFSDCYLPWVVLGKAARGSWYFDYKSDTWIDVKKILKLAEVIKKVTKQKEELK